MTEPKITKAKPVSSAELLEDIYQAMNILSRKENHKNKDYVLKVLIKGQNAFSCLLARDRLNPDTGERYV